MRKVARRLIPPNPKLKLDNPLSDKRNNSQEKESDDDDDNDVDDDKEDNLEEVLNSKLQI